MKYLWKQNLHPGMMTDGAFIQGQVLFLLLSNIHVQVSVMERLKHTLSLLR